MSRKFWISAVAAGLAIVSAIALADDYRDDNRYDDRYDNRYDERYDDQYGSDYEYARVVDVEPLRRRVRVSEPVRECWEERGYRSDGYRSNEGPFSSNHVGGTLLGGLIGGALGNQVGHGDGRQVAKAAGAIIGGAVGYNASRDRERQRYGDDRYRDDRYYQRCETRYRDSYEERVDGYEVTYEYAGRHYVTQMPYDPGERIRIRVDVTPTGG